MDFVDVSFAEIQTALFRAAKGKLYYLHFGTYSGFPALQLDGIDLGYPKTLQEAVMFIGACVPVDPLARALDDLKAKYGAEAVAAAI
jgi:hypothetical protein